MRFTYDDAARLVTCPECGAVPGQCCESSTGRRTIGTHFKRRSRASEFRREAETGRPPSRFYVVGLRDGGSIAIGINENAADIEPDNRPWRRTL